MEPIPDQTSVTSTEFTALQQSIFNLLCSYERLPKKKEIAEKLGITPQTVGRAMADPVFMAYYQKITMSVAKTRLHEVMEVTADVACDKENGSHLDRRLYFEVAGIIGKNNAPKATPPPDDNEALEARKKAILERIKQNSTEAKFE